MRRKRFLSLFLAILMVFSLAACAGDKPSKESTRKRAEKGQDTTTFRSANQDSSEEQDTGLLKPLETSYAKSNKAGIVYDPQVFLKLDRTGADTVKVACAGDSITYGAGASDTENASYPAYLQKMLNENLTGKYTVYNCGAKGATVTGSASYVNTAEYKKLRKAKPDAVILMLGSYDIAKLYNGTVSIDEFITSYMEVVGAIRGLSSSPVVYLCTPIVNVMWASRYYSMDALYEAVASVASASGCYLVDTYHITEQYFTTHLIETDCLLPGDAGNEYLAGVIYDGIVNGKISYTENEIAKTENYVVYVNATRGSATGLGTSASDPVNTMQRAVELCKGGGTIVVSGPVTPTQTVTGATYAFIAPKNDYEITVTSIDPYDGTDYRSTNKACIYLSESWYLHGDFKFKNVDFKSTGNAVKLCCNYNDVTFDSGVSVTLSGGGYPVLILGHDVVSIFQTASDLTCQEDCRLTVKAGSFAYLRGGNWINTSASYASYQQGTVKDGVTIMIDISGGSFLTTDSSNVGLSGTRLSSALGQNGLMSGASVVMNISGGTFKGSLFAVPRMNPYKKAPVVAGSIAINISGGYFNGSRFDFLQRYAGDVIPAAQASYHLNISGGEYITSTRMSFDASGSRQSDITLSGSCSYLEGWGDIVGFTTKNGN